MASKKVAAKKVEKKENRSLEMDGAVVRLTQAHLTLEPGDYKVDGCDNSGDPFLVSSKGTRVSVPLEKIEIIKPVKAKKSKAAVKAPVKPADEETVDEDTSPKQMELGDKDNPFTMDPMGQITLKDLDTPLGKLAKGIVMAQKKIRELEDQLVDDNDVMMKEMKRLDKKVIVVLGYQMEYQAPKTSNAKLIVKELQ